MSSTTITREAYDRLHAQARDLAMREFEACSWANRECHHADGRVTVHRKDPVGPWFLRWCTPDGSSAGMIELAAVDPQANPMERDAADDLCREQERKHPTFLWFVSNERAPRIVRP